LIDRQQVLLNKQQIWCGGDYPDCYHPFQRTFTQRETTTADALWHILRHERANKYRACVYQSWQILFCQVRLPNPRLFRHVLLDGDTSSGWKEHYGRSSNIQQS